MAKNFLDNRLAELLDLEEAAETKSPPTPKNKGDLVVQDQEKFGLAEYDAGELEIAEINDEQDKSDKELARASIRNVLKLTNANLGALFELAKATEHPRAFEVAATLAKTVIDAAGKLDDIVEPKTKPGKSTKVETGGGDVFNTQNIYMSSEEAMKMLRDRKNGIISQNESD